MSPEECMLVASFLTIIATQPKRPTEYDPLKKVGVFCLYALILLYLNQILYGV